MAFIDGPTLRDWVKEKRPNARQIALKVAAVARAVAYAHAHGVIHRDIKPSNILIDSESGQPILTDFGLAKELGYSEIEVTQTGQIMGTPAYMAPEQAAGQTDQVGPSTDIYSLGALLYELLTGHAPFTGPTGEVLRKVQTDAPVAPRKLVARLHKDLETIVLKAMSKAAKDRYASAQALAEDLERFAAGEPIVARRQPMVLRAARFVKRNRVPFVVAALLLVTSGIVIRQVWSKARISALRDQVRTAIDVSDLWDPPRLQRLDASLAQLESHAPQAGADLRRQAGTRLLEQLQEQLNSPELTDAMLDQINSRIEQLPARGVQDVLALRKLANERRRRWEKVAELSQPFDNLSEFFSWQFSRVEDGLSPRGYGTGSVWELSTQYSCPDRCSAIARFTPAQDAAGQKNAVIGLLLSHEKSHSRYMMTVNLPASLVVGTRGGKLNVATGRSTQQSVGDSANATQSDDRVRLILWRNGRHWAMRDYSTSRFKAGAPFDVQFSRDGEMVQAQLNDLPPLAVFDAYPEVGTVDRWYGVVASEPVRLTQLTLFKRSSSSFSTPLEQPDILFSARRFLEARDAYRTVALSAADDRVRQEARFKEALCLLEQKQPDEAAAILETVSTAKGERWPTIALMQLWALRLQQRNMGEADNLLELLRVRASTDQIRMLLPALSGEAISVIRTTCRTTLTEGANLATINRAALDRHERTIVMFDALGDSNDAQMMRYFQIKARHQIGDLEVASRLAEQYLNDPNYDNVDWIIHVVEEYGWIRGIIGDTRPALEQIRRRLEKSDGTWREEYLPLLVERARLLALAGDWAGAKKYCQAYVDGYKTSRYRWLGSALLLRGFIAEQENDTTGAKLAWRQGARRPSLKGGSQRRVQELSATASSPDEYLSPAELQYACMVTSLSGEMADAWGAWYLQSFVAAQEVDENPDAQNPLATLKNVSAIVDARIARDCWLTPRGHDLARKIALHQMDRKNRLSAMPTLIAYEMARRSSPTQPLKAQEDEVYWQAARDIYDHFLFEKRGTSVQIMGLLMAWKGVTGPFGWQGAAPTLPTDMRGRFAYVLARKLRGQGRNDEAIKLLKEAVNLAEKDAVLLRLIKEELKLP